MAAAVSGRVFASELVGEVAEAGPDQLVDAFDEAERARLITPGKAAGELVFSHELIRQTLLSGVSAGKRERLHSTDCQGNLAPLLRRSRGTRRRARLPPVACGTLRGSGPAWSTT